MPYNGSGSFSLAQPAFVANTSISSAAMNSDLSDIATNGLTNAVTKDGQTTLTGVLKGANGSVTAPMYSFATDLDSGMYRIGANNVGIAVNAANVLDIATTGLAITGALSASGDVSFLPAGVVVPYAGSTAPTGWLICDGSSLLRASFPGLFTAIGTTYGAVDGTHFSLPDPTGRAIVGKEAVATRLTTAGCGIDGATLGASGGLQTHTLITAELPSHSHTITDPGHVHDILSDGVPVLVGQTGGSITGGPTPISFLNYFSGSPQTTIGSHSTGITGTNTAGSGTPHAIVQPTIVMNFIIRT